MAFLFFIFFHSSKVLASPNTDSMLGYWKFDGNTNDVSGHGNNLSLSASPSPAYTTGRTMSFQNPYSLSFGTDSYVGIGGSNPDILKPTSSLTFSLWINPVALPNAAIAIAGQQATSYNEGFFFTFLPSGQVSFSLGNGSSTASITSTTVIPTNTWTHLAGVWNPATSTITLYITTTSGTTYYDLNLVSITPVYTTTQFELGKFDGKLDDVRLYNRALGASSEISDLALGKHTTSSWISSASSDFETPSNWSPAAVPDPYTKINIYSTTSYPAFSGNESVAGLYIGTGSSLDIGNYNLTMNDSASFVNNGTLILDNSPTQNIYDFVNDTDSGTVIINGATNASRLAAGSSYYNLTFSGANFGLDSNLAVNGNLTLENGTLDLSSSTHQINVKGNWTNSGGTFNPGNSTVTLNGIDQSISGSNTFYNLSKTVSAAQTLTFQAGSTQTITNNLILDGASSTSQLLSLRSSTTGTQWKIDPQGNRNVSGVDVKDSNNINSTPITLSGINANSGNNTNWIFDSTSPSITLSSFSSPTSSTRPSIKGKATESNVTISAVQFQIDSNGTWQACTADDGTFNSNSEDFTCRPATSLSDSEYTMYVRATDANSNTTASSNYSSISFRVDNTPPDISSVSSDPGSTSADIKWDTDEYSSSQVEYGKSSSYGNKTSEEDTGSGTKSHKVSLSGLSSCTEYHYQVKSTDKAGNKTTSSDRTFETTGCASSTDNSVSSSDEETASSTVTTPASDSLTDQTTSTSSGESPASDLTTATNLTQEKTNYNGSTSEDWQIKYFGSTYCYDMGKCGANADPDGDGVPNSEEYRLGTDPLNADSDNDGVTDATEIESGHDPTKSGLGQEGDAITYEDPKEKGELKKEVYAVKEIALVDDNGVKKLKIAGKGPPNTFVTIFIYSDPIVLTIKTDSDGNWSYVLEQDIEDGQHEVYVAVTDNTGKISEKSEPLAFVKTAEAVTIIPPAEAAATQRAESPTEVWYKNGLFTFILIMAAGLLLALGSIGIYKHRTSKQSELAGPNQNP